MTENQDSHVSRKLQFSASDELWGKVLKYKIDKGLKNNNQAVEALILEALSPREGQQEIKIAPGIKVPDDTMAEIRSFRDNVPIYEKRQGLPILIFKDKKSDSFYTECHITGKNFIELGDTDATIDPDLQEEFRANRELEPDNFYFIQMVDDAKQGRQFSDLVIEYNTDYGEDQPLKILGGQHRHEALKRALSEGANELHGIRTYFNLTKEQRAEIMRISNTNINVSSDLRDRIVEHSLTPPNILRNFCYEAEILGKDEDFGDKRRYEEEFSPTVRTMRSFVVNYFIGRKYTGDADKDAVVPYLCSTGKNIDPEYLKIFNKFKLKQRFDDKELLETGKMFAKLHDTQYKKAEKFDATVKKEYKIKTFSLSLISSWAFAAGYLQKYPERLKKLYELPSLSKDDDPLNAKAMSKARHKTDSDSYRGLGTRTDKKDRGRLLQLFLNYSKSDKPKITDQMCSAAIDIYHANKARIEAETKAKSAF